MLESCLYRKLIMNGLGPRSQIIPDGRGRIFNSVPNATSKRRLLVPKPVCETPMGLNRIIDRRLRFYRMI